MIDCVQTDLVTIDMCYKDIRKRAPSRFKGIVVIIPEEAWKAWDPVIEILTRMEAGGDLSLEELKEVHDVFERLSSELHKPGHYEHQPFCEYFYRY
jgi:hypothetical protein